MRSCRNCLFLFLFAAHTACASSAVHLISVASGVFDLLRTKHRTWELEMEYKYLWACSPWDFLELRPLGGVMATATGSVYVYGGLNFDLIFWDHLLISPGFAAGYYAPGGGKNLGYPLEFRSGVEVGYQFSDGYRIGAHFYHLSNASLGRRNPGEESLVIYYDIPIGSGFPFTK